jgi:predicted metal-dependent peptidase
MKADQKMRQARTELILRHPFFGALALRLALKEDTTIDTAGTDGKTLAYNPKFIDGLTVTQATGLVAHEVLHVANGHPWRRDGRDMETWNAACDFAINGILKAAGFYLPEDGFHDPAFDGQSAEAIYTRIKQDKQPDDGQQGQQGQNPGQDGQGKGQQGKGWGDVMDDLTPEAAQNESENKIATLQAAAAAKAAGKLPAGLERLIDEIKHPAIDWKAALRRFVQQTAAADYTWQTPNSRYLASGLYLPALKSEQMRPLVVGVDTSGSVGAEELATFGAEIQGIMQDCRPEALTVVYCDAAVNRVEDFAPDDEIKLSPCGGGGTCFAPVFAEVEERNLMPACLVYLTDMENYDKPVAPDYPVLWVNVGRRGRQAPFGEIIDFPQN